MARWGLYDVEVWNAVLSSVAPSTKIGYQKIFFQFVSFFEEKNLTFRTISIADVLSFLKRFRGLSKSRVRTGVAAMKFFLRVYNRLDLVQNPLLDMLSKGLQNLAPLPVEKKEIWNPNTVLEKIRTRPRPTSFLCIAREAAILLLLATGWRVDDMWKLGREVIFSD
jgi:site-specific recombinase XerD